MTSLRQCLRTRRSTADPIERRREAHDAGRHPRGHRRRVTSTSSSCAVRGTCRRCATATTPGRPRRDAPLLRGLPKVKAADHVGAVDAPPAGVGHRATAPASPRPAGTTTCTRTPAPTSSPAGSTEAARVLRAADHAGVGGRCRRGDATGVHRSPRCAAARWPAWPRSTTRRARCSATGHRRADAADQQRAGHRHADRHRCRDHTPMVPLARNLAAEQKRCRLKPEVTERTLELDLRKPLDLAPLRAAAPRSRCSAFRGAPRPRAVAARARSARRGSCGGSPSSRCASSRRRRWAPRVAVGGGRGGRRSARSAPSSLGELTGAARAGAARRAARRRRRGSCEHGRRAIGRVAPTSTG